MSPITPSSSRSHSPTSSSDTRNGVPLTPDIRHEDDDDDYDDAEISCELELD